MKIIKAILRLILLALTLILLSTPFWFKNIPANYYSFLTKKSSVADKYLCNYSVKISGQAMIPLLEAGSEINLTKCFDEDDLTIGSVVLFKDNSNLKLGVIRHILNLDQNIYKISDEKAPNLFNDKIKEEIFAINNNIDTSNSIYQTVNDEVAFILQSTDLLSEFYLAKIPKDMGLENATLEKTFTFNKQQDKFCWAINPLKQLTIEIKIINLQTKKELILVNNAIFQKQEKINVNCSEFSNDQTKEQGKINLEPGDYQLQLLVKHQVIEKINFSLN